MHVKRGVKDLGRLKQILSVFLKYGWGQWIKQIELHTYLPLKNRLDPKHFHQKIKSPEDQLTAAFEELGGSFVKLGQLLSIRPDLVPESYCQAFRRLRDTVAPFPFSDVQSTIKHELGHDIQDLFTSFDKVPLAAASISQVHRATLKSGEKVVVKVQRPGIQGIMETDIDLMYFIAKKLEKHEIASFIDPVGICQEFEAYTKNELDFVLEARNIDRFAGDFKNVSHIIIPRVYRELTTRRIVVMEYIDGVELLRIDKKKVDKSLITQRLVKAGMKMIFEDGFFHADPHPGNILIKRNMDLAFIDFGIIGSLTEGMQARLADLFIAVIDGDVENIAEGLLSLNLAGSQVNVEEFTHDLKVQLREFYNVSLADLNISEIFLRLILIAKKYHLRLPAEFVLLGKSLMTLEGACVELDPKFNFFKEAKPYARHLKSLQLSPRVMKKRLKRVGVDMMRMFSRMPRQLPRVLDKIERGDFTAEVQHKDLDQLTKKLDQSSMRISSGVIIAALVLTAGLTVNMQPKVKGISIYSLVCFGIAVWLLSILSIRLLREAK